jgi:UDP-N-acetylmuramoyl-tripeptide--D-alanyl-D-alanine ligase
MKNLIKRILILKLDLLAKLYIWRFKPEIVAVTGNVGKTSTKEAIAVVLSKSKNVRSGKGNLNNELGVPLTILGDWSDQYYNAGILFWPKVLIVSFFSLFFIKNYPEILVLEYGADRPGDIARLVKKYRPKIGVITAIGDIPVHVEYFADPKALAREKFRLISSLKSPEYAVLNHDDPVVLEMKEKTNARVMSYGFTEGATLRLSNFDYRSDENESPDGIVFKINYANTFVPCTIHSSLGKSQAFAAGAAASVGIIYGMNLIEIVEALTEYKGPKGRLKILKGIKNTTIIDDTYNAAPSSTQLALETLKELSLQRASGKPARKIAVLGDMLELGEYTVQAHEEAGNLAGNIADILITVGARAKFMAYAAGNQLDKNNIYSFVTSDSAKIKVQELIKEGDLVLIKGSQGMRMEKIVEEIMAEPLRKKELLVRQGKKWSGKQ